MKHVKMRESAKRAGIEEAVARGALRTDTKRRAVLHVYVHDLEDVDQ